MKFEISKNKLQTILKLCHKTINDQMSNQILSGILIHADQSMGITFISSNTNVSCKNIIKDNISISENGCVLVKCSLLLNLINKIKDQTISFQKIDQSILRIKAEKYTCDLNLLEEHTYPSISFDISNWTKTTVKTQFFKDAFNMLSSCVSPITNSNSILSGILIDAERLDNSIEAIATDSYHLAYIKNFYEGLKFKLILGIENLKTIIDVADVKDEIDVYFKEKKVIFSTQETLFCCRTIDGEYPSTIKAIESVLEHKLIVKKDILVNAIDRACVFNQNDKKQPSSLFKINSSGITIQSKNIEYGASHEEIAYESYSGPDIEICLNTKYLNDLLKNINSKNVVLELQNANKQVMIKDEENKNYSSLILPIRYA